MIGRLLMLLFNQKIRNCGSIPLQDNIEPSLIGQSVLVVSIVYAICLVSFRPIQNNHMSHNILIDC